MPPQDQDRKGALKSLINFSTHGHIYNDSRDNLYDIWEVSGKPYIKEHTVRETMGAGQRRRAYYSTSEDFPQSPDTVHVVYGDIDDALAEFSHAIHYNTDSKTRKLIKERIGDEWGEKGEDVYKEGPYAEHFTHSILEPALYDWYEKGKKENLKEIYNHINIWNKKNLK